MMIMKKSIPALDGHIKHNSIVVRSPGRINLIGEHTDYNDGFVLPAAIDKAAYISLTPGEDEEIHLRAIDLKDEYVTSVKDIHPVKKINWPDYLLGVAAQFVKAGISLKGFKAALTADIPIGAGLSSSAAVECAMAFALNEYTNAGFDKLTLVKMAQKAEHEFAGVKCGIMDQFASVFGKKNNVVRLDCRSLQYEYEPFDISGHKIVLLDTNVKHSLASSEYNVRRQQCEAGVALIQPHHPDVKSLRDASVDMLNKYVEPADELIYQRCKYVVEENNRLLGACADLKKADLKSFGKKMFATHDGLSRQYAVSCKELDFLVEQVRSNENVLGARMMGGGFGGCTINIIKEDAVDDLIEQVGTLYNQAMNKELKAYVAQIEEGTTVLR